MLKFKSIYKVLLFFILTFIFTNVSFSQNNMFSLSGGISKAVGQGTDDINLGFNGAFHLFAQLSPKIYLGGKFAYNYFSLDTDQLESEFSGVNIDASMTILELIPMIRITPTASEDTPPKFFVQVGYGLYSYSVSVEVSYNGQSGSDSDSDSDGGLCLGLGFIFGNEESHQFELVPCYNIIFTEGESTKYFSANLGIQI